ncbi:MAG: DUF2163 domain-containing protein [Alphaproteobacteria bacterium]|nr:MAG: DUF2163 domain-containing protein [Alphaproteobacteria bacterium]
MPISPELKAHLESGVTTLARCWAVTRRDGAVFGFTDHDRDLSFEGITFRAGTGLSATTLEQTTGLALDNTEALGALSDAAITEADIRAGRFDGARVEAWLVNWADPSQRYMQFRGTLGEITSAGGAFRAELVGLSEALNAPQGRVYQSQCSAVLGDGDCKVNIDEAAFSGSGTVVAVEDARRMRVSGLAGFADGWFAHGRLIVESGAAAGLEGVIRADTLVEGTRALDLWEGLRAELVAGDVVRLVAGCDRRAATCRNKFDNFLNFRGFPDIPGEDRLASIPLRSTRETAPTGAK